MQEIIDPREQENSRLPASLEQGNSIQQVRSAFATAVRVQKARNLPEVKRKLLEEARLMGEDAYYGWGAGKNAIEGPSIDLAVAAARCWGNCATDMLPVQDLRDCWIFTAAFIDLETGYTRTRQFRQSKEFVVHGKMDDERKDDIRFQVGQSKAERNVILKALPSWLINAALEAAKEGVRAELDKLTQKHGVVHVADRLITALMKCGAKETAILAKCGVVERKGLTVDHLVILRGDLNALQSGQERVEVLFPLVENPAMKPEPEPAAKPASAPKLADTPPVEKKQNGKDKPKVCPQSLETLYALMKGCHLSPPDRERLLHQLGVHNFEDLSEDAALTLIDDLKEQLHENREPGMEDEDEEPKESDK